MKRRVREKIVSDFPDMDEFALLCGFKTIGKCETGILKIVWNLDLARLHYIACG